MPKWLHDHQTGKATLRAGQLAILDEASLAGTHTLHRIAAAAAVAGAKVLLVGDPAQLAAIDAGGAFTLLAQGSRRRGRADRCPPLPPALGSAATLQLRDGNPAVLDAYSQHGRLRDGDAEQMLDAAYTAWRNDLAVGK